MDTQIMINASEIPSQPGNHVGSSLLYHHCAFHKCHTLHNNPRNAFPCINENGNEILSVLRAVDTHKQTGL